MQNPKISIKQMKSGVKNPLLPNKTLALKYVDDL